MRIGFTGGGTGGHFYPLIAVAEELRQGHDVNALSLYYFGPEYFDKEMLAANQIYFIKIAAGKSRTYSSILNFLDKFKILYGIMQAMIKLAIVYPDVIFSKGGYVAFPVLFAARILRIPIVIHDSDTVPGRTSVYSASFSKFICVAWSECGEYFHNKLNINSDKIIYTGLPIRRELNASIPRGDYTFAEFNKFDARMPIILFIGGSQGAEKINDVVMKSLPILLPQMQIIHQTGVNNFDRVKKLTDYILKDMPEAKSYLPIASLSASDLRNAYSSATLVVSRGGSQILEFFGFGLPSIVIPIENSNGDHQRQNAYGAMHRGASIVIEEKNLTSKILENEILRLLKDKDLYQEMKNNAKESANNNAAKQVSEILLHVCQNN
jgi:UDP-N-acetylglucosamine--N-acetylmuramyl-(pentapeptide) pyrophosphoryl-undecaprenol N-acetylglucosamine transferase